MKEARNGIHGLTSDFWSNWNTIYIIQPLQSADNLFKTYKLINRADGTQVGNIMDYMEITAFIFQKRDEWDKELEKIILG